MGKRTKQCPSLSRSVSVSPPLLRLIRSRVRFLRGDLFGDRVALGHLPPKLLFGPGDPELGGGDDAGEQERAEEESQAPRPDDPLRALNTTVDSDRVGFEDPGGRGSEFVLDRAQAGVQLLVHKGQLGAQRPALCGKLLVNLLRDQLSEFLAELIAVHQHSISWGVSRAHAMPRRVLSLGAGRVLTHESLLRLWQPVAAEPGWFCTWGRFGMQAPHFHSQCRGGL